MLRFAHDGLPLPSVSRQLRGATAALLIAVLAVGGVIFVPQAAQAREAARRPNVVLIITDDQGYGDLGCHGNTMIETPNLDRLFAESTRLIDFHVDPTCAPTRAALMTGRNSGRTGVWHTIKGRSLLRRDEYTMANVFADSGYRTGMFGKWHLGDNYPYRPQDRGFHEVLCHGGGGVGQAPDRWGNDYFDDTYLHNGVPTQYEGYCTDVWFDGALKFIEQNQDRPFFCYLATNAPHSPYRVADEYSRPYTEKGVPQPMDHFYGMITNIDENVGRLRARLEELGLDQNTLVLFMSDNGSAAGTQPNAKPGQWNGFSAGMRGTKGSEYDGGHRVPCFWSLPGTLAAGRDVEELTAHTDVLPTLVELCDLNALPEAKRDGTSLVPLLTGDGNLWPERTLFVDSQRIEHPEKWRKTAVMTDRWRLINGRELYDIQADPGQKQDVAQKHPEVVSQLTAAYDAWWQSVSERFDEYCPIVIGSERENPARLSSHDWHTRQFYPPWNQEQIRRNRFSGNGHWVIDVSRPGRYKLTLRLRPLEAGDYPLGATDARVAIAGVEKKQAVDPDATAATFVLELSAGETQLQTWLTESKTGKECGAFYVYAEYLGE